MQCTIKILHDSPSWRIEKVPKCLLSITTKRGFKQNSDEKHFYFSVFSTYIYYLFFMLADLSWSLDNCLLLPQRYWFACHSSQRELLAGWLLACYYRASYLAHSERLSTGIYHRRCCWNILGHYHNVSIASHGMYRYVYSKWHIQPLWYSMKY